MKLWKIWQEVNNNYDTYDSAVVVADTEEVARKIHPYHGLDWNGKTDKYGEWACKRLS